MLLEWISVKDRWPPLAKNGGSGEPEDYVLAIDAKDRMSVGYAYQYSTGELGWTFAKPISEPTHWMRIEPPRRG